MSHPLLEDDLESRSSLDPRISNLQSRISTLLPPQLDGGGISLFSFFIIYVFFVLRLTFPVDPMAYHQSGQSTCQDSGNKQGDLRPHATSGPPRCAHGLVDATTRFILPTDQAFLQCSRPNFPGYCLAYRLTDMVVYLTSSTQDYSSCN